MLKKNLIPMILSCLVLILALVNILLDYGNHSLQNEVAERQQTIAQGMQLEALHRQVVSFIAEVAAKTNDPQLKQLLAGSGVSFEAQPEANKSSK